MAKYKDIKSLGKSEIAPYKENENFRKRHQRRKQVNLENQNTLKQWCDNHEWKFEIKNNGNHWIFTKEKKYIEWWPSTAKLVINKQWKKGLHCHDFKKVREILISENWKS